MRVAWSWVPYLPPLQPRQHQLLVPVAAQRVGQPPELVVALATVAERAMSYVVGARTVSGGPFQELTDREREVLELVARGCDNTTIARTLVLSGKTVRNYVHRIFTKLDVNDRAALVARARDAGVGVDPRA